MKTAAFIFAFIFTLLTMQGQSKTIYNFKVKDIDNKDFDMSNLKGKKVLIVNVASKCGLTPQYEQLEQLYKKYKGRNFVIIGFPSNNFKEQEPDTNAQIKEFCTLNYGVTFPMMAKTVVKGDSISPLYKWLTTKTENGKTDAPVQWNFQKFMIDQNGQLVNYALPAESPFCDKIIDWLEGK